MKTNTIWVNSKVEQQATGCNGASSYRQFANTNGYKFIEILNWTSSAGDWEFIVSKDGNEWFILYQTNNYPRGGFSHQIDTDNPFYGSTDQVLDQVYNLYT